MGVNKPCSWKPLRRREKSKKEQISIMVDQFLGEGGRGKERPSFEIRREREDFYFIWVKGREERGDGIKTRL